MRQRILKILRQTTEFISGEELRQQLGVSRVSIWKHMKKLREMGYRIESSGKGYRLANTPQPLTVDDFPDWQDRIHIFESVDSTMTKARELAQNDAAHLSVVVAERQTHGRGRLDRHWASNPGGLFFSVVCRPNLPAPLGYRLLFAAGISLVTAIRDTTGVAAQLKWPNDILVDGQKVAGMLAEMDAEADQIRFLILGIGVNISNQLDDALPMASRLDDAAVGTVSRRRMLTSFLTGFSSMSLGNDGMDVIAPWKRMSATIGRQVTVKTISETISGLAVDVDHYGALIVRQSDGRERSIVYGDCFHDHPADDSTV